MFRKKELPCWIQEDRLIIRDCREIRKNQRNYQRVYDSFQDKYPEQMAVKYRTKMSIASKKTRIEY